VSDINTISQSGDLLRNIDVGEMLRLREQLADCQRELEQDRQDRRQADLDTIRALGERNDARAEAERLKAERLKAERLKAERLKAERLKADPDHDSHDETTYQELP